MFRYYSNGFRGHEGNLQMVLLKNYQTSGSGERSRKPAALNRPAPSTDISNVSTPLRTTITFKTKRWPHTGTDHRFVSMCCGRWIKIIPAAAPTLLLLKAALCQLVFIMPVAKRSGTTGTGYEGAVCDYNTSVRHFQELELFLCLHSSEPLFLTPITMKAAAFPFLATDGQVAPKQVRRIPLSH